MVRLRAMMGTHLSGWALFGAPFHWPTTSGSASAGARQRFSPSASTGWTSSGRRFTSPIARGFGGKFKRGRIARWGGVEASPKTGARQVDCSYEGYHRRLFAKAWPEPDLR